MRQRTLALLLAMLIVAYLAVGCAAGVPKQNFMHVVTRILTVGPGNAQIGDGTPSVTQTGESLYVEGQLEVDGEAQFDGAVDANGAMDVAGAAAFGSTITLEGVAFSGPLRFGSATVGEGVTEIAHGLGVTPTMMVLTPLYNGTLTQTVYVTSSNTISMYALLSPGSVTQTTVYWAAGR